MQMKNRIREEGDLVTVFSGWDPMEPRRGEHHLSLAIVLVELCSPEQGKFGISDIRGAPPSSSLTPILRALWMPRAVGAEPAGCLASERRGPTPHTRSGMLLPACLGTQTFAFCSFQDSLGKSAYV